MLSATSERPGPKILSHYVYDITESSPNRLVIVGDEDNESLPLFLNTWIFLKTLTEKINIFFTPTASVDTVVR